MKPIKYCVTHQDARLFPARRGAGRCVRSYDSSLPCVIVEMVTKSEYDKLEEELEQWRSPDTIRNIADKSQSK